MKTSSNNNSNESKNRVYNAIVAAIKGDRMIGRHIAQTYGTNGPRPVYGIEVWESVVYVHTDTDRRIFDKAIDRLLKAHEDLFKWADFQKASEEGPHIVLALTEETVKAKKEEEKAIREAEKAAKEREKATLEPASEITEFFTKGKKYRCIKSVVMKKGGKTAFKAGNIYKQVGEPSHWVGWLRNEQGERHSWPQPVYIAHEVKTWGTKPEDIDPRLYFEPVSE